MLKPLWVLLVSLLCLLTACSEPQSGQDNAVIPWVKTAEIQQAGDTELALSATLRARYEVPLSFQVGGKILRRYVDAGQVVSKGQLLFLLDPKDVQQTLNSAKAAVKVAEAALATARAELSRNKQLVDQKFISSQLLEQYELNVQEASARLEAATAQQQQAEHGLSYTELRATESGILLEVIAEPGQVMETGQTVARLALDGVLEAEVHFPQTLQPVAEGELHLYGQIIPLSLRETSGALDAQSRTWRSRYQLPQQISLPLGTVTRVIFRVPQKDTTLLEIPVSALDERGAGTQVWQIKEGLAQPAAVELVDMKRETAIVRAQLQGNKVIALGTHLLQPGMAVRELP